MNTRRRSRPVWLVILVYLVLMPAMIWLGFWQLDRADMKRQKIADFEKADTRWLTLQEVTDPGAQRFRRVKIEGHYLTGQQVLIDNIVRRSRNGFFVITPFETNNSTVVLVNRGWVAQTPTRKPTGDLTITGSSVIVQGRIGQLPVGGIKLGEQPEAVTDWPAILQFPSIADIARLTDRTLANWVLLADTDPQAALLTEWRPGGLPPERHLGYAVQWFAMAFTLTILMLIVTIRSRGSRATNGR